MLYILKTDKELLLAIHGLAGIQSKAANLHVIPL